MRAAKVLREGRLVAFPTETVYGLGADATNVDALKLLYRVKGRPHNHPVIVHLAGADEIRHWAERVPDAALALAERFWPGPLTLILPAASHVLRQVTGGQDTIGLRVPNHPLALALLKEFGKGVAAPSANRFGRISPTTADDVIAEFGNEISCVLDGGPCDIGIESTIVDCSGSSIRVLRPGMILLAQIESVVGHAALSKDTTNGAIAEAQMRAPGGLPAHYAPTTPLRIVEGNNLRAELAAIEGPVGVLSFQEPVEQTKLWIVATNDPRMYARHLYNNLRKLDQSGSAAILVEQVPPGTEWLAIRDRLSRAASSQTHK